MIRCVAVISLVALSLALPRAPQRFTSRADAVRVDLLVTNGSRLVAGLTAADFELRDTGVVQRVEQIEVERIPLNLVLVFDTSGSVAGPRLSSLLLAGSALLDGLRVPDRVALVSFGTRVRLLSPLTADRAAMRAALNALSGEGATPLRDAAFAALALREADPGRTLMLLFTDGADTASWITAAKVLDTARRTDVVIYPVAIRQTPGWGNVNGTKTEMAQAKRFLDDLADTSGGRVMLAGGNADLRKTFAATLAEFRERYVLSYQPVGVPAVGWHPIEVTLKGKRGKVTARRGYFAQ